MSTPAQDTEAAWRVYGERVNHFVDAVALDPDNDTQTGEMADVIVTEARMIAEQGPASYLAYLADLEARTPPPGCPRLRVLEGGGQ